MTHGHVAIITKTESTYVMIESTLQFDDVEDISAFSRFSRWFKGHVCDQENGAGDGLGTRLGSCMSTCISTCMSTCTLVCMSTCISTHMSTCVSTGNSAMKVSGRKHETYMFCESFGDDFCEHCISMFNMHAMITDIRSWIVHQYLSTDMYEHACYNDLRGAEKTK